MSFHGSCPNCGAKIKLRAEAILEQPESKVSESDVRAYLGVKGDQFSVELQGNFAIVRMKKYNQKKWNQVNKNIANFGGQYVKGFWKISVVGLVKK